MLNLRRTFWKENIYSCNYRWGSDVPIFTNILAIFNPITNNKNLNLLQIDIGASLGVSSTVLARVNLFTAILSGLDLSTDIIKYNPKAPNPLAKIYSSGSLTLDKVLDRRTIMVNTGTPSDSINFNQEFEIEPGKGVCVVHESEYSGNLFYPYVTLTWWE